MAISLQTGIREYHGDLSQYTGMLGGLTPDVHTLRSLNPLTTNRVICVMYRGPYFLMHYFGGDQNNAYDPRNEFGQYKKIIEAYNTGITCNIGDATLAPATLQGGFAGRSINIPTTQNAQNQQSLQVQVPEMVGRPVANFHNMWVDGIADPVTGLTTYHGLVAGSVDDNLVPQRIFAPNTGANALSSSLALEPSPAWEVAEFLVIVLDRSGARVEAATMALGCVPSGKVGNQIFNSNATGQSQIASLDLNFSCQFIQSAYVNDLASRYVEQFAIFGNSINLNPGAGDAFFDPNGPTPSNGGTINTPIFNGGERPYLDAVQSGLGNAPVMSASKRRVERTAPAPKQLEKEDHSKLYINEKFESKSIANPYETTATPNS
jgi:hypothetical protein